MLHRWKILGSCKGIIKMEIKKYVYSDNWWPENDKLYICDSCFAAVFCVDIPTKQCEWLACIPDCKRIGFRLNSFCRKYKEKIVCFPYDEKYICFYDIGKGSWTKMEVGFAGRLMVCMDNRDTGNVKIWLMEHTGRKIFQVNIEKEIVEKEYIVPLNKHAFTGQYVFVQDCLYCAAGNEIYCINLWNGNMSTYQIAEEGEELYTICHDGHNFWLSGGWEKIYVWNTEEGIVQIIADFIEETSVPGRESSFLVNNVPLFGASMLVGKYVWYIPLQSNAPIIYIDKDNYRVETLEIDAERETKEEIAKRKNAFKYAFEYIRQNRYIGLYSCKNRLFFEIDTVELSVKYRSFWIDDKTVVTIAREIYADRGMLYERTEDENKIFGIMLNNFETAKNTYPDIGKTIYINI